MRYLNKFIALGLGIGLTFTGTHFIQGWFSDSIIQTNKIVVAQEDVISIKFGENAHFTVKHGNKFKKVYIPVNINTTADQNNIVLSATASSSGAKGDYDAEPYIDKETGNQYILISPKDNQNAIEFKANVDIVIKVAVKDDNNNIIKEYTLECSVPLTSAGNSCDMKDHPDDEKQCHIDKVQAKNTNSENTPETEDENIDNPSIDDSNDNGAIILPELDEEDTEQEQQPSEDNPTILPELDEEDTEQEQQPSEDNPVILPEDNPEEEDTIL